MTGMTRYYLIAAGIVLVIFITAWIVRRSLRNTPPPKWNASAKFVLFVVLTFNPVACMLLAHLSPSTSPVTEKSVPLALIGFGALIVSLAFRSYTRKLWTVVLATALLNAAVVAVILQTALLNSTFAH